MKTKTLDISDWADEFPGKEPEIIIKKMGFGEFTEMQDKVAEVKVIGKQQIVNAKMGKGKLLFVVGSIEKAPFEISEKGIKSLPYDLGEFIFQEVDSLSEVSQKK